MKQFINVKLVDAEPRRLDTNRCPPEPFEKQNLPIVLSDKITPTDVEAMIKDIDVQTIGAKTTIVRVTLINGFELTEHSTCVNPANYDEKLETEIALGEIRDQIWFLLGFLLQSAKYGFNYEMETD